MGIMKVILFYKFNESIQVEILVQDKIFLSYLCDIQLFIKTNFVQRIVEQGQMPFMNTLNHLWQPLCFVIYDLPSK